jgi:hypothetical protein
MRFAVAALPTGRPGRLLALGIAIAIPLVLWFGLGAPLLQWHAERAATLVERRELARRMQDLLAEIPDLQRRASQEPKVVGADSLLAGDSDAIAAAALQEKVQAIAAETGATVSSAEILPAQELGGYRRIGLKIAVYARVWSGLVRLLQGMQQATPKMLVGELEIRAMPTRSEAVDVPVSATITVLAYRAAAPGR